MKKLTLILFLGFTFVNVGCSMKAISRYFRSANVKIDRIKAPEFNLGNNKKLALVNVSGPWKAKNYFSSKITEKALAQDYFRFINLDQGQKHQSQEIRIVIDTGNNKATAQQDKKDNKAKADYLLSIQVLEWEKETHSGQDEKTETSTKRVYNWNTHKFEDKEVKKTVYEPWLQTDFSASVNFQIIEAKTQEIFFAQTFNDASNEKIYTKKSYSTRVNSNRHFNNMTQSIIGKFLHKITPYYVSKKLWFDTVNDDEMDKPGTKHAKRGRYDSALHHWLELIKISPNRSASYHNAAVIYHAKGKLKLAKQFYVKAMDLNPKSLYMDNLSELEQTQVEQRALQTKKPIRMSRR